jgi:hypothetical protein
VKYQNFADAEAIVMGLRLQAVARLKKTSKAVGKKYKKTLKSVQKALEPAILREKMRTCEPPMIPALDLYIQELTEISELPDTMEGNPKMINYRKLRGMAKIFEELEKCREGTHYAFRSIPKYQDYICFERTLLADEDAMRYSKTCEPELESFLA